MNKRFIWMTFAALLLAGCASQEGTSADKSQTGAVAVANAEASGPKFDLPGIVKEMQEGDSIESGESCDAGVWVVCRVDIAASDNIPENELAARATILAKKAITEWMGSEISSSSEKQTERTEKNGQVDVQSHYKSVVKTKSESFLRGVTLYSIKKTDNGVSAFLYVTGKTSDATDALEKQLKAAPPGVVRAVGFGVITNGQLSKAKRAAVQSALQNAVEQVMGTTVIAQSQLMDNDKAKSKVISQTMGSVKQYRVVKEGQEGVSYQVILNAEVNESALLENYAAMVRSMGNPPFMIRSQDPDLKTALTDFFVNLGFKVTENAQETQFFVDADCNYLTVVDDYYGKGIQIDVGLTLSDAKSKQQLISMRNAPKLTSTYSGSFHQIRQSAAKKAFKTMKKELHEKLNKIVMDWVLNGHEVKVTLNNLPGNISPDKIAELIGDVPCAKFQTKMLNGASSTFVCTYVGPTADFEEFLRARFAKDLPAGTPMPKTQKIDLNEIVFQF